MCQLQVKVSQQRDVKAKIQNSIPKSLGNTYGQRSGKRVWYSSVLYGPIVTILDWLSVFKRGNSLWFNCRYISWQEVGFNGMKCLLILKYSSSKTSVLLVWKASLLILFSHVYMPTLNPCQVQAELSDFVDHMIHEKTMNQPKGSRELCAPCYTNHCDGHCNSRVTSQLNSPWDFAKSRSCNQVQLYPRQLLHDLQLTFHVFS